METIRREVKKVGNLTKELEELGRFKDKDPLVPVTEHLKLGANYNPEYRSLNRKERRALNSNKRARRNNERG